MKNWVYLKSNVKYNITDKESVLNALQSILKEEQKRKKYSFSIEQLRLKFAAETGVPFGHTNCGSLLSFLQQYPNIFEVKINKGKSKHQNSRVSLKREHN
jgi:hypothetical protein